MGQCMEGISLCKDFFLALCIIDLNLTLTEAPIAPKSGFKTRGQSHPKSKTEVAVAPQIGLKTH